MAKQPPPLQDANEATVKILTDKINRLESGSGGKVGGSSHQGYRSFCTFGSNRWHQSNQEMG
jgi:hypothetical protein